MSHDIYSRDLTCDGTGDVIAHLSRSAGNPLNSVIYAALESDDLYAGCSGCGESRTFTRPQLIDALRWIDTTDFAGKSRQRNLLDDIADRVVGTVLQSQISDGDVSREIGVLLATLSRMNDKSASVITISFG